MNITIDITGAIAMTRTIDNIKLAMAVTGCFVAMGLVGAGFWWLFEMVTGYTNNLFRLAGF